MTKCSTGFQGAGKAWPSGSVVGGGYTEWLLTASQGSTLRLDLQVDVAFKGLLGDSVCQAVVTHQRFYMSLKAAAPAGDQTFKQGKILRAHSHSWRQKYNCLQGWTLGKKSTGFFLWMAREDMRGEKATL